jgi:hypothetical protein
MKGLDHLVLCGRNLAAMRQTYSDLGFTLTPEALHPFGTGNSLVQLDHVFLELLSVVALEKIPEQRPGHFSFAAFNRDFLNEAEGFSMLVLDSVDAAADVARYRRYGLQTYEPFHFSRKTKLATGQEATVGFSLAFVTHPAMPRAGFFCCQQHAPQYFWQPAYQRHANGAVSIREVALVVRKPPEWGDFLEKFTGHTANTDTSGLRIATARGDIAVLDPERFRQIYQAEPPDLRHGPQFAGFTVSCKSGRDSPLPKSSKVFGTVVRFQEIAAEEGAVAALAAHR